MRLGSITKFIFNCSGVSRDEMGEKKKWDITTIGKERPKTTQLLKKGSTAPQILYTWLKNHKNV